MGSWSVILNILLLAGVMIAIVRTMMLRRGDMRSNYVQPMVGKGDQIACDDIIAVRKVNRKLSDEAPTILQKCEVEPTQPSIMPTIKPVKKEQTRVKPQSCPSNSQETGPSLMVLLLAKEDRQFSGYDLLQTLLAAGLRFGEGQLFHRHQHSNGQGPVLCSVAAATSSGTFDLQNIGAFSVRGLCIFMETSGNATIDGERFVIMLEMARQLSEDLDAYLLDDKRQPFTDAALQRYRAILNCSSVGNLEIA